MNNQISDTVVFVIIICTIFFVFLIAFSVKSPERKLLDEPLMWRDDFSKINYINNFNKSSIYLNANNLSLRDFSKF
tara:strand:+ start:3177 stop:3404 length:228 start_codon:yes stop_codon:yes gene_type:complete